MVLVVVVCCWWAGCGMQHILEAIGGGGGGVLLGQLWRAAFLGGDWRDDLKLTLQVWHPQDRGCASVAFINTSYAWFGLSWKLTNHSNQWSLVWLCRVAPTSALYDTAAHAASCLQSQQVVACVVCKGCSSSIPWAVTAPAVSVSVTC